ncbi:transketolase [Leucobacter allii]|uniref:Transketolase n=1 Tax=Leucobacter allii TaxID=2932247 RepID=A0ABY4FNI9_9MICO|nr:transketolase [Leucobacter allii]UOQ57851.1 transketolase [Leucobacter allii]
MTPEKPARPSDDELAALSREGRWRVISTVAASGAGHIGGPLSAMDLLISLYFGELRIDPAQPQHPDRDRFILSKGHNAIGLYSVLAMRGFFPLDELATFDRGDSRLQGHPDMKLTPGVDASSGSLGQGLSAGAGMALAARRLGKTFHTWVMLGDGELEEGMVWESVISAPRYGLDNLTAIVDLNGLQQFGWPRQEHDRFDRSEPMGHTDLEAVFTGFGWRPIRIDGHDFGAIRRAFDEATGARGSDGRPSVILADTAKGRGVSFAEGAYRWHNGVATDAQLAVAHAELGFPDPQPEPPKESIR